MKIRFIGATHEVTGSCTLLELRGRYYLVDCGMEQGRDVLENVQLPIPSSAIDAVFLTHAHIDHSGMLPRLYKEGFRGKIYSTDVTADLCNIMLRDSAHIQESEAQWRSRKSKRAGAEAAEPIYTMEDAEGAISLFIGYPYGKRVQVAEGLSVRFTDIGHLLGSACIELWLNEGGTEKKIVFSGDVGNNSQRIIRDPEAVEAADYVVIESTYGNRVHSAEKKDITAELAKHLQRAFDRGGTVVIPSFAVGRTQEMLYAIREIKERGLVTGHKNFPVYVDSPLASEATAIFMQCNPVCFDEETLALIKSGKNPLWFDGIRITEGLEESKNINADQTPKVIISASGMCEAGRIRHHLKHNLWKKNNLILFVGYQTEGSLGRRLLNGARAVTLFGEEISVKAEIASLNGMSGHADKNGLLSWLGGFKIKPELVFVNHGDYESCEDFKNTLLRMGYNAQAPFSGSEYDLYDGKMTVFADAKAIERREKGEQKSTRSAMVHRDLVTEAQKLLELAQSRKGRTNKDNAKLTSQIRSLIEKWKD